MKIVVSANGKEKDSKLDQRFGRCECFQIHDTDTGEFSVVENVAAQSQGGAGIAAASQVIEEGAQVLLTGNLGPNAFEIMEKSGVQVYSCEEVLVEEAISLYQAGKLSKIGTPGKAHHGVNV